MDLGIRDFNALTGVGGNLRTPEVEGVGECALALDISNELDSLSSLN